MGKHRESEVTRSSGETVVDDPGANLGAPLVNVNKKLTWRDMPFCRPCTYRQYPHRSVPDVQDRSFHRRTRRS